MTEKIEQARRAMADIDARAHGIKDEIRIMLESDSRMKDDESYRNRVIGEKLAEVHRLQEESQVHQRLILQNEKSQGTSASAYRVSTRSKSTASNGSPITNVAANIQQMPRQSMIASNGATTVAQGASVSTKRVNEADQTRSVMALLNGRKALVERESALRAYLDREGLVDSTSFSGAHEEYATVKSLREQLDSLCHEVKSGNYTESTVSELREILRYVETSYP